MTSFNISSIATVNEKYLGKAPTSWLKIFGPVEENLAFRGVFQSSDPRVSRVWEYTNVSNRFVPDFLVEKNRVLALLTSG